MKSFKNGDIYVGSTSNISNRIMLHNAGKVKSTKGYRPWELLESIQYETRSQAVKMEMFYKTGQQKEILRKKYTAT